MTCRRGVERSSDSAVPSLLQLATPEFASRTYNHARWFFGTAPAIPLWTGYTLGFRVVRVVSGGTSGHIGEIAGRRTCGQLPLIRRFRVWSVRGTGRSRRPAAASRCMANAPRVRLAARRGSRPARLTPSHSRRTRTPSRRCSVTEIQPQRARSASVWHSRQLSSPSPSRGDGRRDRRRQDPPDSEAAMGLGPRLLDPGPRADAKRASCAELASVRLSFCGALHLLPPLDAPGADSLMRFRMMVFRHSYRAIAGSVRSRSSRLRLE